MIEEVVDDSEAADTEMSALEALDSGIFGNTSDASFTETLLIDDPVTGVGNEDLWEEPECSEEGGEDDACGTSQGDET